MKLIKKLSLISILLFTQQNSFAFKGQCSVATETGKSICKASDIGANIYKKYGQNPPKFLYDMCWAAFNAATYICGHSA